MLARALERAGFVLRNVGGSHHPYVHPEDPTRWTVVPMHNRDLKPGTLRAILTQARLTQTIFVICSDTAQLFVSAFKSRYWK